MSQPAVNRPYVGGQALIEGVMMRSPHSFAAVVRRRDGSLTLREAPMADARVGWRGLPLARGVVTLVEALKLGSASLRFSAELYEDDIDAAEREEKKKTSGVLSALCLPILALATSDAEDPAPKLPEAPAARKADGDSKRTLFTVLSVVLALGLFVALPQAFAEGMSRLFKLGLDVRSPGFQLLTGAGKISIIVGYMLLIRRLPEIRRVFQYHGAEHKSIYVYEAGEELIVANARPKATLHPRCGTTFLVMVALVSIVVFTALGPLLPEIGLGKLADNVAFFLLKLPFVPVIAAITFEIQRVFARYCTSGPLRALLWPGFLVQKVTTIEPDDQQLEVALAALRAALGREVDGQAPRAGADRSFASFETLEHVLPGSAAAPAAP